MAIQQKLTNSKYGVDIENVYTRLIPYDYDYEKNLWKIQIKHYLSKASRDIEKSNGKEVKTLDEYYDYYELDILGLATKEEITIKAYERYKTGLIDYLDI